MTVHKLHKSRFLLILRINLVIFIAELLTALYSGSLAMLSDSLHVSIHVLAPFVAYLSEFEFLGFSGDRIKKWTAWVNIFLFFFLAGFIAYEAWQRLSYPPELRIGLMFFLVAILGLGANVYCAGILHRIEDKECHQNIQPLFWHMVFDSAGSVIVIIGAAIMSGTQLYILDPVLSFILAGLIVAGAVFMLHELSHGHDHSH